tara:strand:- start:251 stop:358 length:108 start_codon:yes stop_codon:yes gene_type:complete
MTSYAFEENNKIEKAKSLAFNSYKSDKLRNEIKIN